MHMFMMKTHKWLDVEFYSLDSIIPVGYIVKSVRTTQVRQLAQMLEKYSLLHGKV